MAFEYKKRIANRRNYGYSRTTKNIAWLVVHFTANDGDSDEANAKYFENNIVKASAHYFIDDDSVTQSVPDNYVAYSVGGNKYPNTKGGKYFAICNNTNSLNIELCDTVKNGKNDLSAKTRANAIEFIKQKVKKYKIDRNHVIRHYDVNGKNCLPIDTTELLTKDGWVSLKDIKINDCIAQYNPDNDEIEFGEVLDVVKPYESEVLKNRGLEATYNHRMYTKPNCVNSHKYKDILWGELLNGNKIHIVKNGAIYKGKGLDLSDDELRLLVWIQGDGHYMKYKNGNVCGIEFHLKKERKIVRIIQLLNDLDIEYTICNKSDGSVSIRNYDLNLYKWSEKWLNNKKFKYNLLEMSEPQFKVFWDELLVVDGNVEKNMYTSVPQINLDVVQSICATKGKRSNKCTLGTKEATCVMVNNSNYSVGGREGIKRVEKRNTLVSCVTVSTGYILIRQNGRTFIVGNCPKYFVEDNTSWNEFLDDIFGTNVKKNVEKANENVANLQKALNESYGCKLKVDGKLGAKTVTEIKKHVVKNYTENSYAKWVQRRLKAKKYKIKIDGKFGKNSKNTLEEFQKKNNLTVDGKCGYNTVMKLI